MKQTNKQINKQTNKQTNKKQSTNKHIKKKHKNKHANKQTNKQTLTFFTIFWRFSRFIAKLYITIQPSVIHGSIGNLFSFPFLKALAFYRQHGKSSMWKRQKKSKKEQHIRHFQPHYSHWNIGVNSLNYIPIERQFNCPSYTEGIRTRNCFAIEL